MAQTLLTSDSPGLISAFGPPQWGIWKDGRPLIVSDSVASIQYARDYQISDYPQEQGAFESYNKVQTPFEAHVGFYISTTRQQFLNAIEAAVKSRDLVTVVVPEYQYQSANLKHYSYLRESRAGVTMILVEVWCEEVRVLSSNAVSDPQSTNGKGSKASGEVQPIPSGDSTFQDVTSGDSEPVVPGVPAPNGLNTPS